MNTEEKIDLHAAQAINRCYTQGSDVSVHGVECRINTITIDGLKYQEVAIRGSKGARDWWHNLGLMPWYARGTGWVHAGFYRPAMDALPKIAKKLSKGLPVVVEGHSKGGPEALFIGLGLRRMGFNVKRIVTMGAPQAMTKKAAKAFRHLTVVQYSTEGDPVVGLPLNKVGFYIHPTYVVTIGEEMDKPHSILSYIRALAKEDKE